MAQIDLIDDWSPTTQTGAFTYSDGRTITYSYSAGAGSNNDVNIPDGFDNVAESTNSQPVTVDFDSPATGVSISVSAIQESANSETATIILNGSAVDLNTLLADGRIRITGDVTGDGSSDLTADGRVDTQPNIKDVVTITFLEPVDSVGFLRGGAGSASVMFGEVFIEEYAAPPCFTAGTLIDTDRGPVRVETLQAGDMIRTKHHGFQPVKWVGSSRVYASGFDVPLRIKKGTFGNTRDLVVSKRHKMLMDHTHLSLMFDAEEAFACAMHLRNDDTIVREPEGWVTYYHVLLP